MIEVRNKMSSIVTTWTIGEIRQMIINKELITIPEFLQRRLLEEKWFANKYQNCKEFIISVWKGTSTLDTFSLVPLDILIERVENKIDECDNQKDKKEYVKIIELLKKSQIYGKDVYVCLDGQSRLLLGIHTYTDKNSKYTLDLDSNDVDLWIDNKKNALLLSEKRFDELRDDVKNYFYDLNLTITIVTAFNKLDDVIEALINKQKGFSWTWFQILKQFNRFGTFTAKLLEKTKPIFSKGYSETMSGSINEALKPYVDGDQLMLTYLTHLYQWGYWPSENDIQKTFTDTNHRLTDTTFDRVQEYCLEYFNFAKNPDANKITVTQLVNYLILRQLMDNVKSQSDIFTNIAFNKKYIIVDNTKFIDEVIKWDIILKDIQHDASGIKNPQTGQWEQKTEGYATWSTGQKTKSIERRMKLFVSYFPFDELESNGIITSDIKMPSKEKVLLHNDFKDSNGNSISMREVKKYDRGHKISKYNKGTNQLDNLVPELLGENRSHQEENII